MFANPKTLLGIKAQLYRPWFGPELGNFPFPHQALVYLLSRPFPSLMPDCMSDSGPKSDQIGIKPGGEGKDSAQCRRDSIMPAWLENKQDN
ncbi:uncharacterized [Tachysurus ichikawai]